jgi:predicted dehydrogenase
MQPTPLRRRHFLQGASQSLLVPAIITAKTSLRAQQKADSQETLRIGLIGCGGRGTGAAANALQADYNSKLTAVADVFAKNIDNSLNSLQKQYAQRVDVSPEHRFVGLDAYQKVIDSGVDIVILATPPGFRPLHMQAAIDAGKHLFAEKPMAVDAVGYRVAQAALAKAKEKRLCVLAGYCWRYSTSRKDAFQRLHAGEFGQVISCSHSYYANLIKPMAEASARRPEQSDVEWQLTNWYNFSWLSGDSYVEQATHALDKMLWAMQDQAPVSCIATGGRAVPSAGGNLFDHFHAAYEFANGQVHHVTSRQMTKTQNETIDVIHTSKGQLVIGKGTMPYFQGEKKWRYRDEDKNMYQNEHDEFFAAIREGKVFNDGERMMRSTLGSIMGREAAYTGQRLTWQQMLDSKQDLAPEETLKWEDSFTPTPLPVPGVTTFI